MTFLRIDFFLMEKVCKGDKNRSGTFGSFGSD